MAQQVTDLGESFRPWQKTIWVFWIAENKVMAVVVVWKQMDWISCSHESTNSRAACHMRAVIWPLVIDCWLQCLFAAALLCVNFLLPLLANLEEACCHESKLPSRAWGEWQDELCEGILQPSAKQIPPPPPKKTPHNKKPLQETNRNLSTCWKSWSQESFHKNKLNAGYICITEWTLECRGVQSGDLDGFPKLDLEVT